MRNEKSFATRVLALILSAFLLLNSSPVPQIEAINAEWGIVEAAAAEEIVGNDSEEVQVTYTVLEWQDSEVRPELVQSGWWVELSVYAPASMVAVADFESVDASVTYQMMQGGTWSEAYNFWQNQASDAEEENALRYVTFGELISVEQLEAARAEGGQLTFSWRFDWSMDGDYEQTVIAVVDPENVTLLDGTVQVYPVLGDVETYTGGMVEGNGTSEVLVNVVSMSQVWSEADESIGKLESGWGIGLRVNAPDGANDSINIRMGEDAQEEQRALIKDQEGHGYLNIWLMLSADVSEDINQVISLDWNADGNYDQTVRIVVDVSELELSLLAQPEFAFETKVPEDMWVADGSYINTVAGGLEGQPVSYALITEEQFAVAETDVAVIDPVTGELTFKTVGQVLVRATKRGTEGYADAVAEYHLNIVKRTPNMTFATTGVVELTYEENLTYENTASVAQIADSAISYYINYEGTLVSETEVASVDKQTGEVTVYQAGMVEICAIGAGNAHYTDAECNYTLEIMKAEQIINYVDVPTTVVYTPDALEKLTVEGGATGEVVFEVLKGKDLDGEDAEVARLNADSTITLLRAGSFTVRAVMIGDACYKDSDPIDTVIYVEKAEQDTFAFAQAQEQFTVTYDEVNNTFTNATVGSLSEKAVEYSIVTGEKIATVNSEGVVTFDAAGRIVVQAKSPADDRYLERIVSYTLVVERAAQTPMFQNGVEISKYYGITEYSNPLTYKGDGELSYAVTGDPIGVVIDSKTGQLAFNDNGSRVGEITVTATKKEDDRYLAFTAEYRLKISYLPTPAVPYVIDGETKNDSGWFTGDVTIFAPEGYEISYSNLLQGNTWTANVPHPDEGINTPVVYLKEADGYAITDAIEIKDVKVDKTAPAITSLRCDETYWSEITEQIFFTNKTVEVAVVAATDVSSSGEDVAVSGIETYMYSINGGVSFAELAVDTTTGGSVAFQIDPQYRDTVVIYAIDTAGNESLRIGQDVIVDNIAPNVALTYPGVPVATVEADEEGTVTRQDMPTLGEKTRFVYTEPIGLEIRVEESNFFEDDVSICVHHRPGIAADEPWTEVQVQQTDWAHEEGTDIYKKELIIGAEGGEAANGDYMVEMVYCDSSTNKMEWTSSKYQKTGKEIYTSNILSIDTIKPTVEVVYDNMNALNGDCYKAPRVATYRITDRNFRPNEVQFAVTKAADINGKPVEFVYSDLTDWADGWTRVGDGDTWETTVTYDKDANYEMSLQYVDIAGYSLTESFEDAFTVDQTDPIGLEISYSDNHANKMEIGQWIYRFFNDGANSPTTVTLRATDVTSGIDYFDLVVTPEAPEEATNIELPIQLRLADLGTDDPVVSGSTGDMKNFKVKTYDAVDTEGNAVSGKTVEVSFEVPWEFRGSFDFQAFDRAGNMTQYGDNDIVVVDSIEPTRTVTYEPTQIISETSLDVEDAFNEGEKVILFYNDDAVVEFTVTEANFYPEDIKLSVNGAQTAFDGNWVNQGGVTWVNHLTLTNETDYEITMEYMDRSNNAMVTYQSPILVIDRTAPEIRVSYGYNNPENTLRDWEGNERDYFSREQQVIVEIVEHNFRADDVVVKVSAVNRDGRDVLTLNADGYVSYFADEGMQRENWSDYNVGTWRRSDDTFELTLYFEEDANYTFEIECKDMALNEAEQPEPLYFTVDQTAPTQLEIDYSTSVLEEVLESVTFGFYNAMMTVDIAAEDETAGIHQFEYSYINSPGVSSVNAQLLNEIISEAEIDVNGSRAEASFTIPKYVLGDDNQFNGTVEFTAQDRADNESSMEDTKRIVVDNISPVAQVTYNAPVKQVDSTSYYSGNITANIAINEANFYAEDVVVTVYRDGANYPVAVSWKDEDVDNHTGTFTLTEEGAYEVAINYTDKSENVMADYNSDLMIIDTTIPSIAVSNIQNNSANKDEVYGFEIELYDANMDVATIAPVLRAVVCTENGRYRNVPIDLGNMLVIEEGKRFVYTIPNLEEDAVYTLTCSATDLAGNMNDEMLLEDEQLYQQVQFSINRNGSTFKYGTTYTEEVVDQYFIYELTEALVIDEINVDPIEKYSVMLNGQKLFPGDGFDTMQTSNPNEWHKRSYVLNEELFSEEGEYRIIVASTDKANTHAYSDLKGLEMSFVVDKTAPVLTISGLEEGGRYRTQEQTVTVLPTDEGGKLYSLMAVVTMPNGEAIVNEQNEDVSVRFNMEGEALETYLNENGGKVTFTVPEGLARYVQIICRDCAFNAEGNPNEYNEIFKNVTVSDNDVVIFYANKPLFYGVVSAFVLIALAVVLLIKRMKNRKVYTH